MTGFCRLVFVNSRGKMRDTGEAIMNTFAINEARKPPRIGSLAMISGTLLCAAGSFSPAIGADLPEGYPPSYYRPAYSGCYVCCCSRPVERPVVEQVPVTERHWVQRDYTERQYATRYEYQEYPAQYRYSPCYSESYQAGYAATGCPSSPAVAGYGEVPLPYRYAASSYHHEYRPPYEYKPTYEYGPRPPAFVPDGRYGPHYGPGYGRDRYVPGY
jgi:hypothetical protein